MLSGLISVLGGAATETWCAEFLITLTKAENFDMTLMFLEDKEKQMLE